MIRVQPQRSGEKIMLELLIYFKLQVVNHPIRIVKILKCITTASCPGIDNEVKDALLVLNKPTTSAKK